MQLDIKVWQGDIPAEIHLNDKKSLAVDSEFSGLNVNRDKLYLVQISTGNNDAHIIQLNRENYNAPNLKKLLLNKDIEKIFHYARFDVAVFKHNFKINIKNIF